MMVRGRHKCYFCEKEFNWLVIIKEDVIEEVSNKMNEERGIPVFTGKGKIDVDVNCPLCRNANKVKRSLK